MKETNFDIKLTLAFLVFAVFLILFSFFIYANLKANFFYEKFALEKKPAADYARLGYYKKALSLISDALSYSSGNADYWQEKGDYLVAASDDGLKEQLAASAAEIEHCYSKAIELNPLNYEYHLKLGWFYANKANLELAKKELLRAAELYPTNFLVYLYLGKYYIKNKDENSAFSNLLLALYYAPKSYWRILTEALKQDIPNLTNLSLDDKATEMKYSVFPLRDNFNFKGQGFPHQQIPLKIKVYAKKPVGGITLERNGYSYRYLRWVDGTAELDIYELNLDTFTQNTYLDDFEIKTTPPTNIEKIEFVYKF